MPLVPFATHAVDDFVRGIITLFYTTTLAPSFTENVNLLIEMLKSPTTNLCPELIESCFAEQLDLLCIGFRGQSGTFLQGANDHGNGPSTVLHLESWFLEGKMFDFFGKE